MARSSRLDAGIFKAAGTGRIAITGLFVESSVGVSLRETQFPLAEREEYTYSPQSFDVFVTTDYVEGWNIYSARGQNFYR